VLLSIYSLWLIPTSTGLVAINVTIPVFIIPSSLLGSIAAPGGSYPVFKVTLLKSSDDIIPLRTTGCSDITLLAISDIIFTRNNIISVVYLCVCLQ